MPIPAQMIQQLDPPDDRGAGRRRLLLEMLGELGSGETRAVTVHNISTTGLLIECPDPLAMGETIDIDLPQAGTAAARVVWESERFFGCEFVAPISAAELGAALLQSVPVRADNEPSRLPGDESFAARLRRLRREARLTLAQVATKLGVSKPTVWAWEQGKARPVEGRIDALARVLGVPASELIPGSSSPALADILSRARNGIAAQLGTNPDKIKIMVEL